MADDNVLEIQTRVNNAPLKAGMAESVSSVRSGATEITSLYRKLAEETVAASGAQKAFQDVLKLINGNAIGGTNAIDMLADAMRTADDATRTLKSSKDELNQTLREEAEAALASTAAVADSTATVAASTEAEAEASSDATAAASALNDQLATLGLTTEKLATLQAQQAQQSLIAAEAAEAETRAMELEALRADILGRAKVEQSIAAAAAKEREVVANLQYKQSVQSNIAAEEEETAARQAELNTLREDIIARHEQAEAVFQSMFAEKEYSEALGMGTVAMEAHTTSMLKANGAAQLFRFETGVRIPRAFSAIIAQAPIVGAALEAAFPILIALSFASILGDIISKTYNWVQSLDSVREEWAMIDDRGKTLTETIEKLNKERDRLTHSAAMLNDPMGTMKEDAAKATNNVTLLEAEVKKTTAALKDAANATDNIQGGGGTKALEQAKQENLQLRAVLQQRLDLQTAELEKEQATQAEAYAKMDQATRRADTKEARADEIAARRAETLKKKSFEEILKLTRQANKEFLEIGEEYEREQDKQADNDFEQLIRQNQAELVLSKEQVKAVQNEIKAMEDVQNQRVKDAQDAYNQTKQILEGEVEDYQIKAKKETALLKQAADKQYADALNALQMKYLLADLDPDNPKNKQKVLNEIEQLTQQHNTRLAELDRQSIQNRQKQWDGYFNNISSGISSSLNSWISGNQSFTQAANKMWSGILTSEIEYYAESKIRDGVHWLEKTLMARQSALQQQAVQTTAATTTASTLGAVNAGQITSESAVAAAAAFASTAAIPIVGPALAPEAAAAAQASVMAYAPLAFFEQGGITGSDGMAFLHKKEMVLPQDISGGLQGMIKNGGSGDTHIHLGGNQFNALDSDTFKDLLSSHEDHIGSIVKSQLRQGKN